MGLIHNVLTGLASIGFEVGGMAHSAPMIGKPRNKEAGQHQNKLSQYERRQSERRIDQASEAAQLGTWEWDVQRDEFWITNQGRALYGYGMTERIDFNRFLNALHPDDRDTVRKAVMRSREERGAFEREYRVVLPDNRVRWIATRGDVESAPSGKTVLMRGVSFDITERKQADECFRLVVESMPNGMALLNIDGRIILVNARMEIDFGYSRQELVGLPIEMLIHGYLHEHEPVACGGLLADVSAATLAKGREAMGRRKDGSEFPLEFSLKSVPTSDSDSGIALVTIVDITARKRTELELERQRNELAHLSRVTLMSELSGSLAHELNQPLMAILSNAQAALRFLAYDIPNLDEVRDILIDIVNDDRRAGEVIRGLRLLLKKGEMRHESFNLNDVVRKVLKLMHSDLLNAGVGLRTKLEPDLPMVHGDQVQLQQVMLNLVMNGCEAMTSLAKADRQIVVATELAADDSIRVSVIDNGMGIPRGDPERLFEPFFTTKAEGLGLGLAVCRNVITAHNGRLWAMNNVGRGASFCFTVRANSGGAA
jgi:two-component system, LuxR family, sensor kinase FixL